MKLHGILCRRQLSLQWVVLFLWINFSPCVSFTRLSKAQRGRLMNSQTVESSSRKGACTMVMAVPPKRKAASKVPLRPEASDSSSRKASSKSSKSIRKRKYVRKRIPQTEVDMKRLRRQRQAEYDRILSTADGEPLSIWSFESLFPEPLLDEWSVRKDLYEAKERDKEIELKKRNDDGKGPISKSLPSSTSEGKSGSRKRFTSGFSMLSLSEKPDRPAARTKEDVTAGIQEKGTENKSSFYAEVLAIEPVGNATEVKVDRALSRMVEDKMYGIRRSGTNTGFEYDTSLMGDGAVKFREGVRLGNPLKVNADRLNYHAKKEMQHGRVEEAEELLQEALLMDPRDGRAYLALARCAERRGDYKLTREFLKRGIRNSVSTYTAGNQTIPDMGANPFLLQALGCFEEKQGDLAIAEKLFVAAARSRPCHAAAWVSLALLRTRKLGRTASAGRACFQRAETEIKKAGMRQSAHVYTAWAALENQQAGDVRRARELFQKALKVDPRCSTALLQLGVMEADNDNLDAAKKCFEKVLTFDQRNSRVLQAYAIMESKRPNGDSRKTIGLFERALTANPRDAGVYQAYALYLAELGDMDMSRELLMRGTKVNKRHAAVWQAWGVMESRNGNPDEARNIFQQGIWSCAQMTGGQSGGYHCARLWQAWGVLEGSEEDYAAARRCFSRALDADSRNVATIIAWTSMEEELGNINDSRAIFERSLKKFAAGVDQKEKIWRAYELMEQRTGNSRAAQQIYQRCVRESLGREDEMEGNSGVSNGLDMESPEVGTGIPEADSEEFEVSRWDTGASSLKGEVWMNDRSIEAKIPNFMQMQKYRTL